MPVPKNETEMEGHGWRRELTIKHIEVRKGQIMCQEFDFFADKMPCREREGGMSGPQCGTDHTWIRVLNGKLFWTCARHRKTNGPISFSVGHKASEYPVDAEQARAICNDTGQEISKELATMVQHEKAKRTGRIRRPNQ